jgi:hypothetical protein
MHIDPSLLAGLGAIAFLYASVGHGGASGYIAVLALAGFGAEQIRPLALELNVVVAGLATAVYARAGHFQRDVFGPLALAAVPAALLGGAIRLPLAPLKQLLAVILLFSAWRLVAPKAETPILSPAPPKPAAIAGVGAGLGLLAGITGTGGGIFLTPWMVMRRWLPLRQAAAVSAAFILVNSTSGLVGFGLSRGLGAIPSAAHIWPMAAAVLVCGGLGAMAGSRWFPQAWIRGLLATVLVVASLKLAGLAGS